MKKIVCLYSIVFLLSSSAFAKELMIDAGLWCQLRVIVEEPQTSEVKADVLFLTGFSDRADNHAPLFSQLSQSGFRVISFDYPSHGKTDCWSLDTHSMVSLEGLAQIVLLSPEIQSTRPLHLIGWSTGGLLAYRMLQRQSLYWRDIKGAVLLTPGLAVYKIPGDMGAVTMESLLSNPKPPHQGPIYPTSPLWYPFFSVDLIATSVLARFENVPNVPLLMILGDDKADLYANTPKIKKWFRKNRSDNFSAVQCAGAKHEVDNEIEPIGQTVRDLIVNFIDGASAVTESRTCVSVE